ncbi:MAG: GAF domain-containing protein [Gemmatimonadaceae bacterium]|nr:GAF domain-containing protein [Gemmatimonadaceae bacterium]
MPVRPKPSSPGAADSPSAALLRRLAGALAPLVDTTDVLRVAVDTTVELLEAVAGAVLVPASDGTHVRVAYSRNYPAALSEGFPQPISAYPLADRLLRERSPVFLESLSDLHELAPGVPLRADAGARAALPLVVGEQLHGALVISFPAGRALTPADRELLLAVGQQVSIALHRATLFEQERRTRREAEDAAQMLSEALDHMTDMHFVADDEWRYVRMNTAMRTFLQSLGLEPDALLGRSMWECFPRLKGGAMHEAMAESRRTGKAVRFVAVGVYANTRYTGSAYPVTGGTAVIVEDTTEQERVRHGERLLAESGAAFGATPDVQATIAQLVARVVPHLADVAVVFVKRDTGSIGVMALESVEGSARDALTRFDARFPIDQTPWHPIWTPINEGRSVLVADAAALVGTGVDQASREVAQLVHDTSTTSLLMVPLQARGNVLGALAMGTQGKRHRFDDTDLALAERVGHLAALALDNARLLAGEYRSREEAERARHAAERASQAKSDFLAMMSHELRTPLNAIAGYAELLELGLRGSVTPEQVSDLQKIRRNQQHLLGLINSVLNFVRLDAGRVVYDVTTVPLAACMGSIESLVEPQLNARRLRYRCDLADAAHTVRADSEKVQQILLNLLDNAIKHTPVEGTIVMRAEVTGAHVHVVVTDSGPGIPSERLDDIFEPFVQAGTEPARQQGMGLGLAISRELSRGMGGDLVARSADGEGASFVLTLPRGPDRPTG